MDQYYPIEVKGTNYDQFLHATRLTLGIVWKIAISALAVAIILGMVVGPETRSENAAFDDSQPVRVVGEGNHYRILTRIPPGKEVINLELYDPTDKQHIKLTYGKRGPLFWVMPSSDGLQVGYAVRPEGDETFSFRTPVSRFNVEHYASGETGIVVVDTRNHHHLRSETWISSEGKVRQQSDAANGTGAELLKSARIEATNP